MMGASTRQGQEIAEKSRRIVRGLIKDKIVDLPPEEVEIIERIVHSTADPEYAEITNISPDFIPASLKALRDLEDILVDVEMIKAGISYDGNIRCYINHPEAIKIAQGGGVTRAAAAIEYAASKNFRGIVVVGNSPTALLKVVKLAEKMNIKAVVGVPVGFVGAAQSKELLAKTGIPYLITRGPKGGTPVAVAVINALISITNK